jgi:uncharacterized protein involved in type VI secretion and phage assembly
MSLMEVAPRETALESGGHAKGVGVAVVRQNKDDSGQGRVKVSYPWHSQPRESYWARVAMPMAGKGRGAYFLPEIDDEVLVAFERGDLRFPYVVGSLWNGVDKSPTNNADGKNDKRMIHTRKGHKLIFDDGSKGLVQLELNDGKKLAIDDDGITLDDGKGNRLVIQSGGNSVSIEAAGKLTLKGASVKIEATGSIDVKSGGTLGLNGSMVNIN